LIEFGVLANK